MALAKVEFSSGLIKDDTPLAAEGGWTNGDKIRFRQGKPEVIGGWELASSEQFTGIVRGAHQWADLQGQAQLAFGTADKLYALSGGALLDITPNHSEGTLYDLSASLVTKTSNYSIVSGDDGKIIYVPSGNISIALSLPTAGTLASTFAIYIRNYSSNLVGVGAGGTDTVNGVSSVNIAGGSAAIITCDGISAFTLTAAASRGPFSTTSGSTTVLVTHAAHGLSEGQQITFSNTAQIPGGVTISGAYTVGSVISQDSYNITVSGAAATTATGGFADYVAAWQTGLTDGTGGIGYGTGTYGTGYYGLPSVSDYLPSVWSMDNFGEVLLACRRGGRLYAWQPAISYSEILLDGTSLSSTNWAAGSGWAFSTGTAAATTATGNLSQNVQGAVAAGYTYRIVFTVSGYSAGNVKFRMNAGTTAAPIDVGMASAPITANGTYSRLFVMPDSPSDILFDGDGFTGTISNVSLKLENVAFCITEAPAKIDNFFIDVNRFVVCLGTYEADGDYNPLLIRWSGQENFRAWVTDTTNLAGELAAAHGGRLVRGIASRQQDLIWSDAAMYSLQFTGDTTAFSLRLMGTGCGLIGKNAAVEHNGIAFWLSNNGNFYIFQGAIPQVIDCRIRRDVFENIAASQGEKIAFGVNAQYSEVWCFYPDSRDGNECSRYAAFNWIENHWTAGTFDRSFWLTSSVFGHPIAFGTDGYVYFHELGTGANGGTWSAYLESSYFDIEDGQNLLGIRQLVPDFEEQSGDVIFYLYTKPFARGTELTYGPFTATTDTQYLNMRALGRQAKIRLESSSSDMFWRLGVLRLDTIKTGAMR